MNQVVFVPPPLVYLASSQKTLFFSVVRAKMPETTALGAAIAAGRASGVDCWNVKEQTLTGQGFVPNNDSKGIYYLLCCFGVCFYFFI